MNDEQRLLVTFEARLNKYEKDLERAKRKSRTNFRSIQKEAEQSATGINKVFSSALKGFGKGLAGGVIAGLTVGGMKSLLTNTNKLAENIAMIGNEAKRAGLSTRAFQELKFVAEQNRIEVDALTDGMKELSIQADEFITTGKGTGAEAFQRLGYSVEDLQQKLKDPSALLTEIIGKLGKLNEAAQHRIAEEIFGGTAGERFVELIDQGAEGIGKTIQKANELGIVMDEELIKRADELNRKWSAIGDTISTKVKTGALELAIAADNFLDRFNEIDEQTTRNVEYRLAQVVKQWEDAQQEIVQLRRDKKVFPGDMSIDLNIERQTQNVADFEEEIRSLQDILNKRADDKNAITKAGEDATEATPPVNSLNNALSGTGNASLNAVNGINSYTEAIRALKDEVPELAASLQQLDAKTKIEAIYQKALSKAQGQREIALANEMRGRALSSLNIKSATDDPTRYLSTLLGSKTVNIAGLQSEFQQKLSKMIASMPENLKGAVKINSGFRSIAHQQELWLKALNKYGSPEKARKWVAPPGRSQHNMGYAADLGFANDEARQWVHQNAGNYGLSFPLANESWHIEDGDARSKQTADEIERLTQAANQQADAYANITGQARQYISAQGTEQQALTMTAQKAQALRYEQQMLNEAQQRGITLTPQQRGEISKLAQGMAQAEANTESFRERQEQSNETARFFGQSMTDALTGIISGTMTAEQAMQQLLQTMIKAAMQAALMGEGPLANLFSGKGSEGGGKSKGGGGAGGLLSSLLGGLFGFAEGGYTGPGGKYDPAGRRASRRICPDQRSNPPYRCAQPGRLTARSA
nr:D-alanyl-D-alanine carboxypeptidase family protein [uncultured Cohaesibacter sp.]